MHRDPAVNMDKPTQDRCAALVEAMIDMPPWKDNMMARGALVIAARAIRRGRHLTDLERVRNLKAILGDGDHA